MSFSYEFEKYLRTMFLACMIIKSKSMVSFSLAFNPIFFRPPIEHMVLSICFWACGFWVVWIVAVNCCIASLHCYDHQQQQIDHQQQQMLIGLCFFPSRSWTKIRPGDWVAHHHKNHGKIDGFVGRENRSPRCVGQSSENQRKSKQPVCIQKTQRQSKKNGKSTVRL